MNKHSVEIRVRYSETDKMGFVYYANYLIWFEIARTEFFRTRGIEYRKLEDDNEIYLPVVEAYCRYRAPLRYDDKAVVETFLSDVGNTRITFDYEVKKLDKVAATGKTTHVFINKVGKPIPVPEEIKMVIQSES